jgi:ABC-2 type transport system permease protein
MTSTLAEAAGDTPRAPLPPAPKARGEVLLTLVRREFWEHRYLWLAPAVAGALLALCALFGSTDFGSHGHVGEQLPLTHEQRVAIGSIVQWALSVPLYIVLVFLLSYYTLDCLFAERKDRSILFWKSLPVSDGLTVISKLLVALVVAPLVVFVLAIATHLVFDVIVSVRIAANNLPPVIAWNSLEWLRTEALMLLLLGLGALWYAPIVAALMLVSAWARRSPFLWATLPPVLAPILERIALGTHHLWDFYRYRTSGIWHVLMDGYNFRIITHHDVAPVSTLLTDLQFRVAYTDPDLWLGVLATAGILYVAVRIRRYRDDT